MPATTLACSSRILLAGLLFASQGLLLATPEKIPLQRCDVLPVVQVEISGVGYRFLIDTGATSMLNLKSFAGGGNRPIEIKSWRGTHLTSAREVLLPEIRLGNHRYENLKLPAVDLTPLAEACRGSIDGILGVDLLEQFGARLDLRRDDPVLIIGDTETPVESGPALRELEVQREECVLAFNRSDSRAILDCFDPQFVLFSGGREIRGRDQMLAYLQHEYFSHSSPPRIELILEDQKAIESAIWFGYNLTIELPETKIEMQGMAICRKSDGRWRLLSMHNSFESALQPPARPYK